MSIKTKILAGILVIIILSGGWWFWKSQPAKDSKGICGPLGAGLNYGIIYCDKSCNIGNDCKFTCGCGAINKDETCLDEGVIYDCVNHDVTCKNNKCALGKERINNYPCNMSSDCVKNEGQCTVECLHKNQEPGMDLDIQCKYRPWFERERCECINNSCTKLSCEDLGLDYNACNAKEQ